MHPTISLSEAESGFPSLWLGPSCFSICRETPVREMKKTGAHFFIKLLRKEQCLYDLMSYMQQQRRLQGGGRGTLAQLCAQAADLRCTSHRALNCPVVPFRADIRSLSADTIPSHEPLLIPFLPSGTGC